MQRFKKIDFYVKTSEGVNNQTLIASWMTLICFFLIIFLSYTEFNAYTTKNYKSWVQVDRSVGASAVVLGHQ